MLGKTAHYDPNEMEVVLYVDNRHPKDVMRSLSHELVHHAHICLCDFAAQNSTQPGYAQDDPHMRKMEREAYTKGNLIFRDFEDLIKTGKINIEIDFSDSGEPKMSLKEWKNNELNMLLMKKWGLLKEEKNEPADVAKADDELAGEEAGEDAAEELEEGCGDVAYRDEDEELEEGSAGDWAKMADAPEDPTDVPTATALEKAQTKKAGSWGQEVRGGRAVPKAAGSDVSAKDRRAGSKSLGTQTWGENKKISVREAKQITRRIIERIKLENK